MQGRIERFDTKLVDHGPDRLTVSYSVQLDDLKVAVKPGQGWTLRWCGGARCRQCRVEITSQREYCYHCFTSLARCDLCVMSPDRCHHHEGTCREPEWGDAFCMRPHTVYLALSSVPKVGITRQGRERRRWADQGAYRALPLMQVPSRRLAGVLERACARWVTDRTDWRRGRRALLATDASASSTQPISYCGSRRSALMPLSARVGPAQVAQAWLIKIR